jgi:YesN/AraC family two-component response regulator
MRLYHQFAQSLDKQFRTKRAVCDYAAELSVTANYLNEAVRTVSGRPASYHIQQRVVQEAKRLALYTDSNMKMVAHSLGFLDSAHFSKFFRKVAGVNFSEFKKKGLRIPL